MGAIIHLVQVLVAACIAYVGVLIVGIIVGIVLLIWVLNKATQAVVGRAMWATLLAALLLGSGTRTVYAQHVVITRCVDWTLSGPPIVYASSVHVSRKAYYHEVDKIARQYIKELVDYEFAKHPSVSARAISDYELRAEMDLNLVGDALYRFKNKQVSQDVVDAYLNQLSRDMEDVPEPEVEPDPSCQTQGCS